MLVALADAQGAGERFTAIANANPALKTRPTRSKANSFGSRELRRKMQGRMEATPRIELGCADLQSAASPLRHVASIDVLLQRQRCTA